MHVAILNLLAELGPLADEHDDYGGFVVYGCKDALMGKPEPEFTDGTPHSCDSQKVAWRAGYELGKKHREALS
jgi:hypothetical protein